MPRQNNFCGIVVVAIVIVFRSLKTSGRFYAAVFYYLDYWLLAAQRNGITFAPKTESKKLVFITCCRMLL